MHVHEDVLRAALRLSSGRKDWTFSVQEVVFALPELNSSTVRTHVVSRCCVNAPKNHPHKWDYFRRIGRGLYQIEPRYRRKAETVHSSSGRAKSGPRSGKPVTGLRKRLHALIQNDEGTYVVECLELPVVTQGATLDEAVKNFREALALQLEGEDLAALGFVARPEVQISYEMPAA